MARAATSSRVYAAVLAMVTEGGYGLLTMEGIAARAAVSKQTLYRSWPSKSTVLFDALLDQTTTNGETVVVPNSGDLFTDLETLLVATVKELTDPAKEGLFRAVAAEIQADDPLAAELRNRLLAPQFHAVAVRLRCSGIEAADEGVELLYGAVFHRWLLQTQPFTSEWVSAHVVRTLRALEPNRGP